jgi:hypothetical protein
MNRSQRHYFAVGFFLTLSLTASTRAGQAESRLTITVQVIDYAEVPERTLIQAQEEVTKIFHEVGVDTLWRDVSGPFKEKLKEPLPQHSSLSSPLQFRILIRVRSKAKRHRNVLAVAFPGKGDQLGELVYVFHRRLEELVEKGGLRELKGRILGLTIAHEIGHLLLPTHSHSPTGIMRAEWEFKSGRDFQITTSRNSGFTTQQAKVIRKVVKRMMEQEGSKGR